jgi:hypothetical protein
MSYLQMEGLDPSYKDLIKQLGLTENEMNDPAVTKFIVDFVEQHGGAQELMVMFNLSHFNWESSSFMMFPFLGSA